MSLPTFLSDLSPSHLWPLVSTSLLFQYEGVWGPHSLLPETQKSKSPSPIFPQTHRSQSQVGRAQRSSTCSPADKVLVLDFFILPRTDKSGPQHPPPLEIQKFSPLSSSIILSTIKIKKKQKTATKGTEAHTEGRWPPDDGGRDWDGGQIQGIQRADSKHQELGGGK